MSGAKILIRFFNDCKVRAVWDDQNAEWWFSVLDIIAILKILVSVLNAAGVLVF